MPHIERKKNRLVGRNGTCKSALHTEALEPRTLMSHTWFVSTTGSNSNPGTLAAPFRTIQYAANDAYAGDTVLIEGGTYHETVYVPHSGTSLSNKITFENYNNESVTIDGADAISGWTHVSGSVWSAPMSTNLGTGNNQVFVDGQMMNEARWPNTPLILKPNVGFDLTNPTLETAPGITASAMTPFTATINDPALTQSTGFWVGATIRIGAGQDWGNQTGTVTASGPNFVTFSYVLQNPAYNLPVALNKYYLYGIPGALDTAGEWVRSNGRLSLWTPAGDSPANHVVEVKDRQYGFYLGGASYVRIQGLHFVACSISTNGSSAHDVIDLITDQYASQFATSTDGLSDTKQSGIVLAGVADCVENSVIADSAGNGVQVLGSGCVVSNNLIHDTDYAGVDAAPIFLAGYGNVVTQNTLYNTGRNGITFYGRKCTISYNNIYNFGLQTTDLAGIYTVSNNGDGTVIDYNTIHDGKTGGYGGDGIRLDNTSPDYLIYRNITWNVNVGLGMEGNAQNEQVYNNTFDAAQWSMAKDGNVNDDWTGTILENNILTHQIEFGLNIQLIDNISNHHAFVNAPAGNFYLLPGAAAIDTGMVLPPYTDGYVGSAPDVGALEYGLPAFSTGAVPGTYPADPTA